MPRVRRVAHSQTLPNIQSPQRGRRMHELTDNDSISSSDSSLAMGASVRDRKSPQESGSEPLESSRRGAQGSRAEPCRGERHLRRHRACGSTTAAMTHGKATPGAEWDQDCCIGYGILYDNTGLDGKQEGERTLNECVTWGSCHK
ncbi:hypothetical protein E2C01_022604 [Portunus trituberculatus]|uniref:Uncharacterized protein n=1 Tax=Portunus trituberculatus TaxID=210409 RepID=A0A5B7E827_PORTR|nr:hypothetical protein [Portunus trituberculatus]